ncbi:sugar kinase [Roseomonas sp. CCTCC AB2023176]|uniref:sugar kinase n=1 Tax=Roseomonas sp. CCTCC AB2023176 TaxID=3342640 RepID=UPI0035D74544
MPDLLCLGEPMLEMNQQPAGPDGRVLFLQGHGGDTSNAAIAATRQGASAGYVSAVGTDAPGDSLMALWATEGVDSSLVGRRADAPTGIYVVSHGPDGHRFTFYRRGSAASLMGPQDVPEAAIRAAKILHLSGISQAISPSACDAGFRAIEVARDAGVLVSYDTNLRLALWPAARAAAVIHAAIGMADIALPSLEDARALTGLTTPEAIVDFYLRLCPLVFLKRGAEGCTVATRDARVTIPRHAVTPVDATGAGDTFAGALLARLIAGDPPEEAARYANVAAALSTRGYGAVAPMPRAAEVRAAMGAAQA